MHWLNRSILQSQGFTIGSAIQQYARPDSLILPVLSASNLSGGLLSDKGRWFSKNRSCGFSHQVWDIIF